MLFSPPKRRRKHQPGRKPISNRQALSERLIGNDLLAKMETLVAGGAGGW